jgi:hypothetical protein
MCKVIKAHMGNSNVVNENENSIPFFQYLNKIVGSVYILTQMAALGTMIVRSQCLCSELCKHRTAIFCGETEL